MFRVIVKPPPEKLHHAVSVMAHLKLAQNPDIVEDHVRGDWMNGLFFPPNVLVQLQLLRDSLPRGTAVSLEVSVP